MKPMLVVIVMATAAIAIAAVAFVLIGPARVWSAFGPADLGTVEFSTLQRRASPNDALACPPELCTAKADVVSPMFAADARQLRTAMSKALADELRLELVATDATSLTDRYLQRSALLQFPDTIVVRFIDQPKMTSTLAIYSRSQLGYGDLGVNKARIERWLRKLAAIVPTVK